MRKNLLNLFSKAVVLQYKFPYNSDSISIPRTAISTDEDSCLRQVGSNDDISNLIYNGIVEYAYNDMDIDPTKLDNLQIRALSSKIKYSSDAPEACQCDRAYTAFKATSMVQNRDYSSLVSEMKALNLWTEELEHLDMQMRTYALEEI